APAMRTPHRSCPSASCPQPCPSRAWNSDGATPSRRSPPSVRAGLAAIVTVLTLADIEAARERLSGAVHETPCAYSQTLSDLTRKHCFVKLENLQMTGSFKERGAANLLLQLSAAERAQGVVTASAGNHGLAVAFHGARLGIPVTIVMPEGAPLIKLTSA